MQKKESDNYTEYEMFKGLQRPLEFMGLQGRYITWAAISVGAAILGFFIAYIAAGLIVGLAVMVLSLVVGGINIISKQRKGLHSKKNDKGIYIYARISDL